MESAANPPENPGSDEVDTEVQAAAPAPDMTTQAEAPTQAQTASTAVSPGEPTQSGNALSRSLERFGRGTIATVAVVAGLVIGIAGTSIASDGDGDHHGHGGDGRFGMNGGQGDRWGGQQGGPPPSGQGTGPDGFIPPQGNGGSGPGAAPGGTQRNGSYTQPPSVSSGSSA